jgi:hypothetical protein
MTSRKSSLVMGETPGRMQNPLVPGKVLGQAIVGDQEGHALRLGEMTQLDSRYRVPSHLQSENVGAKGGIVAAAAIL